MNRPALRLVSETAAPIKRRRNAPTVASAATHLARARNSGRTLSLELAASARRLAVEALAVASLGDAVAPGVREDATRTAAALVAFADRVQRLAGSR